MKLIEKFGSSLKPVDKKVKKEELILFLDRQTNVKFDRETFEELCSRVEDKGQDLTPANFARVYYHAFELLGTKKDRAFMDGNNFDRMMQKLRNEKNKNTTRLLFERMNLENPTDSSNYLTFEYSPDYATNFYDFSTQDTHYLLIPEDSADSKINLRVTLNSPKGEIIDTKNVSLFGENHSDPIKVKFKDSSTLYFSAFKSSVSISDYQNELADKKTDLKGMESFATEKRNYLANIFPDIFLSTKATSGARLGCGIYLIISCVLTAIIGGIGLYLNFTRCMFLDVLIALSFFSNIYIWRTFNMFLAVKMIVILLVSICLDLSWEVHKIISFNNKYEETVKAERIKGLVLSGVIIVCKLALMFFYYKLSRENHKDGFLALTSDVSVNEVNAEDYLMNPVKAS